MSRYSIFFLAVIFLFVCGMVQGQEVAIDKPYVSDANTVVLFHFDEGTGQVVKDSSGKGNDGQLGESDSPEDSDPKWTDEAKFGKALSFDGVDDYVLVPDSEGLNPGTGDFTLECWTKVPQTPTDGMIILKGNGTFHDYRLYLDKERHVIGEIVGENNGIWLRFKTEESLSSAYHHLAFVMDRDDAKISGVYVDGQRVAQRLSLSGWNNFLDQKGVDLSNDTPLYLGITPWARLSYNGLIDELRISKVAQKF